MDVLNKIADTVTDAAMDVSDKSKEYYDLIKLRRDLRRREEFLNRKYMVIGKELSDNRDNFDMSMVEAHLEDVDIALATIEELNEKILGVKGGKTCPGCGSRVALDHAFCPKCGAKVEEEGTKSEDTEENE